MDWGSEYQRAVAKALPKKTPRKDESEFQHKIRQWSDEVKERPGRFPGGQKQAIAIAAEQSGASKNMASEPEGNMFDTAQPGMTKSTIFDGWLSKGFGDDDVEPTDEEIMEAELAAELEDADKGAFGSGFSSGQAQGAGYASGPGGGAGAAVSAVPTAVGTLKDGGSDPPSTTAKSQMPQVKDDYQGHGSGSCNACNAGTCPHGVKKALHSRAMAIPHYMRPGMDNYDPEGIRRSATSQTSSMYTSLSPQVRESMEVQESITQKRMENNAVNKCATHGTTFKSQNCPLCSTAKSLLTTRTPFGSMRFGN